MEWRVVESVPVSEAIKTRTGEWERHTANYATTLARLGAAGIRTVVYNFMPVLDWVRTDLHYRLPDGSEAPCLRWRGRARRATGRRSSSGRRGPSGSH